MFKSDIPGDGKLQKKIQGARFKELDSLRGIAALYVMMFHFSGVAYFRNTFLDAGVTGVDLFFIISGYVIFMSLEKTKRPADFIISRISRLFPSYIVMMCITILIIYLFNHHTIPSLKVVFFNSTMLQPWFLVPYIDDSYWTLFVELLFYACILVLFVIKKLDDIILTGTVVLVLTFFYYLIASSYFPSSKFYIVPRTLFPLVSHFQLFFAGILFYKLKSVNKTWINHVVIVGCFLLTLFIFGKAGRAHFFIDLTTYAISVGCYFVIFYLFIYNKLKFLTMPLLVFFGSISYGVYLLHQQAAIIVYPYMVNNLGVTPFAAISILFISVILIASFVTYKIERPVIKLIRENFISAV